MNNGNFMTRSSFRKFRNKIIKKVKASANELRNKSEGLQLKERKIGFTPHMFRHVRNYNFDKITPLDSSNRFLCTPLA